MPLDCIDILRFAYPFLRLLEFHVSVVHTPSQSYDPNQGYLACGDMLVGRLGGSVFCCFCLLPPRIFVLLVNVLRRRSVTALPSRTFLICVCRPSA